MNLCFVSGYRPLRCCTAVLEKIPRHILRLVSRCEIQSKYGAFHTECLTYRNTSCALIFTALQITYQKLFCAHADCWRNVIVKSVYHPGGRDIVSIFAVLEVLKDSFQLIVCRLLQCTVYSLCMLFSFDCMLVIVCITLYLYFCRLYSLACM